MYNDSLQIKLKYINYIFFEFIENLYKDYLNSFEYRMLCIRRMN